MILLHPFDKLHSRKQQGAALMIMLVILVLGAAAFLVSSLSRSGLRTERDKVTIEALAQARDALIGRAVADDNRPGSLPCPDFNNDGQLNLADDYNGSLCKSYIGRLPWKTLGLPDLRDSHGEHLWYALSTNFSDNSSNTINSDTQGMLNINGTNAASNVIAIVFSPGNAINGQSRSSSQAITCTTTSTLISEDLCATNYLEGSNAYLSPNTTFTSGISSNIFNDQSLYITHNQLFSPVEMRIARETKSCLDGYAQISAGKYPWATPVNNTTNYLSQFGVRFGRLPVQPGISLGPPSDPVLAALVDALSALQLALNNYSANTNSSTIAALSNAGSILINSSDTAKSSQPTDPPITNSVINQINQAGDEANKLANGQGGLTVADIQSAINTAKNNLIAQGVNVTEPNDTSMSLSWPPGCPASYWTAWRDFIFYQVADGYQPGGKTYANSGPAGCTQNTTCLTISGSGNPSGGTGTYHAAVAIARKMRVGQTIRNPTITSDYLEASNQHSSSGPTTTFETYSPTDTQYQTVNDLILCVDGGNFCK